MEEITDRTNDKLKILQRMAISANLTIILFLGIESGVILYNKAFFAKLGSGLIGNGIFRTSIVILIFALLLIIIVSCISIYSKKYVYNDSALMKMPKGKLTALRVIGEVVAFLVIVSTMFYNSRALLFTEIFSILFLFSLQILVFSRRLKYVLLLLVAGTFSVQALILKEALIHIDVPFFAFWIISFVIIEFADALSCIVVNKNT